jgi:hypothetical protein
MAAEHLDVSSAAALPEQAEAILELLRAMDEGQRSTLEGDGHSASARARSKLWGRMGRRSTLIDADIHSIHHPLFYVTNSLLHQLRSYVVRAPERMKTAKEQICQDIETNRKIRQCKSRPLESRLSAATAEAR